MEIILLLLAIYYLTANAIYLLLLNLSARLIKYKAASIRWENKSWPKVSVIVSAFNEGAIISRSVKSLLNNKYPNLEILIVNDGSTDDTFESLRTNFDLYPLAPQPLAITHKSHRYAQLQVIDKNNSGKSDSLNQALKACQGELVVTLDADTFLESSALYYAAQMMRDRPECMAVGGSVRILNGSETTPLGNVQGHLPSKALTMWQVVEYIRSFFGGRLGWESLGGTALLSGAFSVFRTRALCDIGGFDADSVTEDFEVIVRQRRSFYLQSKPCEIHMLPQPLCWTIVPESLLYLFRQRVRWQRGLVQTLWTHKQMIFNPRFGRTGWLTLPYMLMFEALSPFVELLGYLVLGYALWTGEVDSKFLSLGLFIGIAVYTWLTLVAIRLEEVHYARHGNTRKSRLRFLVFSALEHFGYRQLLFVARLKGNFSSLRKTYHWAGQNRTQLEEKKEVA